MYSKFTLIVLLSLISFSIYGQELVSVVTAASYNEQVFYTLSDDETTNITNESWDLAFYMVDDGHVGIHVNESIRTSFGNPQNPVLVYNAIVEDFDEAFEISDLGDPLQNDELFWEHGALNSERDLNDPFDFGWGISNDLTGAIDGTAVYAIKMRTGTWYKIMINQYLDGVYELRIADLDGSNDHTVNIDASDFAGHTLIYYNMELNTFANNSTPQNWDLFFSRYVIDISGADFSASGVLANVGVQVAEAREVDPGIIDVEDYEDFFYDTINIIGSDWKQFNNGWELEVDLSYFIISNNHCWQIWFVAFEGSSSGEIFFEKLDCGEMVKVEDNVLVKGYNVFPNPSTESFSLTIESLQNIPKVLLSVFDISGKKVLEKNVKLDSGLNAFNVNNSLSTGQYQLDLSVKGNSILKHSLIIK